MAGTMKTYKLVWSPTGRTIATVQATTMKAAKRKAPKPYSKYKGEIYAEEVKSNGRGSMRVVRNTDGYKDAKGIFHPIRSGDDYDPEDVGERHAYAPAKRKKAKAKKRKNPATKIPMGKFIKVDKVKVNRNGTIDILLPGKKRPRR